MNVKISSTADRGTATKERLILKALAAIDIGDFVVFRTRVQDGSVTTGVQETFWFPDKPVSAGDLVVLYTKAGTQSEKGLTGGRKAHFFYWGQTGATFWDNTDYAAVVLQVAQWVSDIPNAD